MENYNVPKLKGNGFEHRDAGSGWSYGTIDNGRGNGNSYYRMTIFPGVNKNCDENLIFKYV